MTCPGCGLERHPTSCIDALRAEDARLREEIERLREQLNHRTIQADRLYRALVDLVEAGKYVSPIAGAVATKASVKDLRNAGNFMKATEKARAALQKDQGE